VNGEQQYGSQPPGFGPPPARPTVPAPWPHGTGRPGVATAAGVLGLVTGGLTALVSVMVLLFAVRSADESATLILLLGLPCAAGLLIGGAKLMDRGSATPLFVSALAAVAVLALAFVVGAGTMEPPDLLALAVFVVLALPLPVLTAILARRPVTLGWTATR